MVKRLKKDINFLRHRRVFFIIALIMVAISLTGLGFKGLSFGIEFVGGTSIVFRGTGDVSTDQLRQAFQDQQVDSPVIQTTTDASGAQGFIVRISETDATQASIYADAVVESLALEQSSAEVTTIGPGWGADVTRTSLIAFLVAIALIIICVAIRFEYKMGFVAVVALIHDLAIIIGVYALLGREVTPNVVAALLTIMGYSLYDTIVVFHRINDNLGSTVNHSFMTVSNHSINQVLIRTINTTLTSLIPVLAMLFFGGETLKDFAFAMAIGLVLGSYSSIAIASPLYALWKQREPKFRKLAEKYDDGVGEFTIEEQLGR